MKRLRYKEAYDFLFLFLFAVFFCWLFVLRFGIFGAKVDWFSQHSVLPDYFRQQFYETGELFPEFAMNIGGGQNICNFSYYGLYSPILLVSYLLPFVKMSDYMAAVQFLCLMAAVLLLYVWLKRRGISRRTAMGTAVMFLLAGPVIFHSYHQIMFVNYMPFLCMGFLGTDCYFEGKRTLLTVSVFLMIMTSFYFSIGGILALVLYGIHRYFERCERRNEKVRFRMFLSEGIHFLIPFLTAVMMSGILLVPTAMVLAGRGENTGDAAGAVFCRLFVPEVSVVRFFYSPYGIGLTALSVIALAALCFSGKFCERLLAWGCVLVLLVPVFSYLLNGGLYIRDKVMIPFLPLLCYVTACYLKNIEEQKRDREKGRVRKRVGAWPAYLVPFFAVYIGKYQGHAGKSWELVILDGIVMLICFQAAKRRGNPLFLLVPSIAFLVIAGFKINGSEGGSVDKEFYTEVTDGELRELIEKTTEAEKGFYRMEQLGNEEENAVNLNRIWNIRQYVSSIYSSSFNTKYQQFRKEIFQTEQPYRNFLMQPALHNPVFSRFMGVKYVISREKISGLTVVGEKGEWKMYKNDSAAPIAYASDRVMTKETYEKLAYPYNQLALLEYGIVEDGAGEAEELKSRVQAVEIEFPEQMDSDEKKTMHIDISKIWKEKGKENLSGEKTANGEHILFLRFRVENQKPSKDVEIWVEGVRNKLTAENHVYYNDNTSFAYTVPIEEGQKEIEVTFGKGRYELKEAECFAGTLPEEAGERLYQAEFHIDKEKTKGNVIKGRIKPERSGYFITSIPYDENFEIRVDGKETAKEEVNEGFLGCRLKKGEHELEIVYHAPGVTAGKLMTAAGAGLFLASLLYNLFFPKYNRKRKL